MDNLRPVTKVSNIQSLAHQPHQSTTSINSVGSSSLGGPGHPPNHSPLGRSVESVGGYSDREALDSDGSLHTSEESPALPSVKKLASRFDTVSQKVNNLDKHGKNNSLSHSGKNIQSSGRVLHNDGASYTNNLNKRNEKPYVMKEVRSLGEVVPPPDPDTYSSDCDNWESDDAATVTSMSLPPTPVSFSNKYSFSTSSLIDTDSSLFDSKDTDTQAPKSFFGVTLRRTSRSSPVHVYSRKRDSTSSEASHADQREMNARRLSSTSLSSGERMQTPSSVGQLQTPFSSEEDTPATLRQSTIIKVEPKPRFSFSETQDFVPVRKFTKSQSLADLYQAEDNTPVNSFSKQQHNSPSAMGYAFAPKGKRSMTNFLRAYAKQKSLHDIHQIDEKAEENFIIHREDDYIQPRFQDQRKEPTSLPSTLRKAKSEKFLPNIGKDSKNILNTNTTTSNNNPVSPESIYQPTTVNGSMQEEIPNKNSNLTSQDSVQASVAVVTPPSQDTHSSEENLDTKESVPKIISNSNEENEESLESHEEDDKPVNATVVYCTGEDLSEIVLNETHVSALQEHLKKQTMHSSDESSSSSSDGGQTSNRKHTMHRHRSVGDLLKEYSNIKSLEEKKNSASIVSMKKESSAENTKSYKTIIAVEDSPSQASPKIPNISPTKSSSLTRPKPKTAPLPMKKSLSHSYFKNVNQETGNSQTLINVSGRKSTDDDGEVFHASTIYVGEGKSDSHPDYSTRITVNGRASPPLRGEVTVNNKHVIVPAEPQPPSIPGHHVPTLPKNAEKRERNKDISDMPDSSITTIEVNDTFIKVPNSVVTTAEVNDVFIKVKREEASDGSHIKVNHVDQSEDNNEQVNPKLIKELIMRESRTGKSGINAKLLARKEKIKDASVPLNSPFSPLRSQLRKKSSSSLSPSEETPPKLASQNSQDEGVDFPSDSPPSTSSQETAGPEGNQPRV